MTHEILVAGRRIESPRDVLADYAARFGGTLAKYDFADRGDPNVLTAEEIWGTRIIGSRVSHAEKTGLQRLAGDCSPLWTAIPFDADIRDADPSEPSGLYTNMLALYTRFTDVKGVSTAKASKILHFKRPNLYPILDSRLVELYRESATQAAEVHLELGFKRLYWAAVRSDLCANERPLRSLRSELSSVESLFKLSELTDLRILDILSWSL